MCYIFIQRNNLHEQGSAEITNPTLTEMRGILSIRLLQKWEILIVQYQRDPGDNKREKLIWCEIAVEFFSKNLLKIQMLRILKHTCCKQDSGKKNKTKQTTLRRIVVKRKKSTLKDWCWRWSSNTVAIWCKELTHWKRPWCWERLKVGEGDDRGRDGWMASPTQWTWVWASSGRW